MSATMDDPPRRRGGFQPGMAKPPGSGMKKGGKKKRTLAKIEADEAVWEEVKAISPRFAGMTAKQIADELSVNPVVYVIKMMERLSSRPEAALEAYKFAELLMRTTHPVMRAVETTTTTRSQVQVVIRNAATSIFDGHADPVGPAALVHEIDSVLPPEARTDKIRATKNTDLDDET